MKKTIIALLTALTATMALNAQSYTGPILVTRNGQTNSATATVTVVPQSDGLNKLVLEVPFMGMNMTLNMQDVPSATTGDITVYSAERNVSTMLGTMYTIVFARTTDGMMTADVNIPSYGVTMFFNTVGDHFQLPNGDMEAWNDSIKEPLHWHSFMTAYGTYAAMSRGLAKLNKSTNVHAGSTGSYSAVMTAGKVPLLPIIANGTMTNGRLKAGSMSATDRQNHAEMCVDSTSVDPNGDLYYMPLYAKPDKFNVWLKYKQGTPNSSWRANVSVKTFDGSYYQEPDPDVTYTNLSGGIVGGQDVAPCDWTLFSFPFDYDSYAANGAETKAIFVDFATNVTPGTGSANDSLYVDDMELVYLGAMTDLRYQGTTIAGWNPAVTTYSIEVAGAPSLDDFTATIEGVSAVLTKSMEQTSDNTYRIAISVVSGDMQQAACYIITATVNDQPQVMRGDVNGNGEVDINDVTALIAFVLSGNDAGIVKPNANMNGDNNIDINDVTALIDLVLKGI